LDFTVKIGFELDQTYQGSPHIYVWIGTPFDKMRLNSCSWLKIYKLYPTKESTIFMSDQKREQ